MIGEIKGRQKKGSVGAVGPPGTPPGRSDADGCTGQDFTPDAIGAGCLHLKNIAPVANLNPERCAALLPLIMKHNLR